MISNGNGEILGQVNEVRETPDGLEASIELNERGQELRREAIMAAEAEAEALLIRELGAEVIAEYENKPEYVLIARVYEDPHAFDGMWYPTSMSEDGLTLLAHNEPEGFAEHNIFFIRVSTDVEGLV